MSAEAGRLYWRHRIWLPPLRERVPSPLASQRRRMMLDVMYLAIGFAFLAVAVFYVVTCDRL
jgi:hypothetical protein